MYCINLYSDKILYFIIAVSLMKFKIILLLTYKLAYQVTDSHFTII